MSQMMPGITASTFTALLLMAVAALSGDKVYTDLFSLTDETEMGHIELSRSADLVVVCPATADLIAKAANGLANDLASTTLLATDKRVLVLRNGVEIGRARAEGRLSAQDEEYLRESAQKGAAERSAA